MTSPKFQHLEASMVGDVAVVRILTKELRLPSLAQEVGTELSLVAAQDWAKKLLVNLKQVEFLCSTGFAVLVTLGKKCKEDMRQVKFCEMHSEVRIGADIIGMQRVAEIYDTEDAALKTF